MKRINMKQFLVIDVEADGPCPGLYSMVSLGAVTWDGETFYREFAPISDDWMPQALAVSNISREEHLKYDSPQQSTIELFQWLNEQKKKLDKRPTMWSDNPAFDWQFVNYYLHKYTGANPLGFSARRIGDYYAGTKKQVFRANEWKRMRKTAHTHYPLDDAKGNMEALKLILSKR
jgi:hypothetical protein|tara:strand:- start:2823 stop:3347 length:525 start_codon:yes stop_codon:yes gene_type:complete